MRTQLIAAATVLAAGSVLAPSAAQALSFSQAITTSTPTYTPTSGSVTLPSATTDNFAIPSGYTLQSVSLQLIGDTTGGFSATNFSALISPPGAPITLNTPNQFALTANGSALALSSDNSTGTVAVGATSPFTVTSATKTYDWLIYGPGVTAPNVFQPATPTFNLPVTTAYNIVNFTGGFGLGKSSDSTQFTFSSGSITYNFVPGPLPIVGVGAALGWSRRLRKRIATTA